MDKLRNMMLDLINQPAHFQQDESRQDFSLSHATNWILRRRNSPYQPDEIYDALKQGGIGASRAGFAYFRR